MATSTNTFVLVGPRQSREGQLSQESPSRSGGQLPLCVMSACHSHPGTPQSPLAQPHSPSAGVSLLSSSSSASSTCSSCPVGWGQAEPSSASPGSLQLLSGIIVATERPGGAGQAKGSSSPPSPKGSSGQKKPKITKIEGFYRHLLARPSFPLMLPFPHSPGGISIAAPAVNSSSG